MAVTSEVPFLHFISVRTELVRPECYYILCPKANQLQDVEVITGIGQQKDALTLLARLGNVPPLRGILALLLQGRPQ